MQLPYANLEIKHQNKEATKPLILPVHLICNTSDEQIYSNIRANSLKYNKNWVKCEEEHDGVAVVVGSAPSMLDDLQKIKNMQSLGGKIFALNNAANVLFENGILADYQVIIDAREETAELVGPAKEHLLGSQVHPKCFEVAKNPRLWHLQVEDIEDQFPDYYEAYTMIGGAASVGNTTTCLAYAMGYRNLQIFGMDSSHKDGVSHAKHQAINDGDPCAFVKFNGKDYLCSLTMKLQAERFQETSRELRQLGCHIDVHGYGLLPDMYHASKETMTEQEKYERMWTYSEYRHVAPGELCVDQFIDVCRPSGKIIDFGCGTGRASVELDKAGYEVFLVDFTENSRDEEAMKLPFLKHDLTEKLPNIVFSKYGFCTDVMEHIQPEMVKLVIFNIMNTSETVFFNISTIPDRAGSLIGQDLHLTVKPHKWWKDLFNEMGYDISYEQEKDIQSIFVVNR